MKLSVAERLTLINQYEIRKLLEPAEAKSFEERICILRNGYPFYYDELDHSLNKTEFSEQDSLFVLNVLAMFSAITDFKRRNPSDEEIHSHFFNKFYGFDGNEEARFLEFTEFIIEVKGCWKEYAGTALNSHSPMVEIYKKMVNAWLALPSQSRGNLDRNAMLTVLKASISNV